MKYMIRLTSLTALLLAFASGSALFWVSQQVQQVEREQRQFVMANLQQEESIRVLKAEWDYLNRPERLEELAGKYLNMAPASAETLVQSISAIPEPEDPTLAPVEISTEAKAPVKAGSVHLAPPTLSQNEVSQEDSFGKVLNDAEEGGQ